MGTGKRLYRSTTDRRLTGVCGGIAEYFDIDPTLVRLAWAAITLVTGVAPGVFVYIVATVIIPRDPMSM